MAAVLDTLFQGSENEKPRDKEFSQTDDQLTRNRGMRAVVTFLTPPTFLVLGYVVGVTAAALFRLPLVIGYVLGLGLAASASVWALSRSFIENDATQAFISVNNLASLLGLSALVYYGPGKHFCYWWESRSSGSSVPLSEAAESFQIEVQVKDGKVTYKASARYRPAITMLHEYVSGVAGVGTEIVGLLKSHISQKTAPMKVTDAVNKIDEINEGIGLVFKHGSEASTPFEKRFGIIMGDATIEEAKTDIAETIKTISENEIIDKATAKSFGYKSHGALMKDVGPEKRFSVQEVGHRRDRIQASSGNLEGMELRDNVSTFNVNVTGLEKIDPEVVRAVAAAVPGVAALVGSKANPGDQGGRKGPKKSKGGKK